MISAGLPVRARRPRLVPAVASVAVGALLAALLAASPSDASATASHYRQSGPGAAALFTTCPGGPAPGVPCTETILRTGEHLIRSDGATWHDEFLVFEQFTEVCDGEEGSLACRPLWLTTGFAGPGEMDLTIDGRGLATASVSAAALAQTCVFTEEDVECGEWHVQQVQAAWTATAPAVRGAHNFRSASRCFVETFHDRGSLRPAEATGVIDAMDLGDTVHGRISNGTLATHSITHTC